MKMLPRMAEGDIDGSPESSPEVPDLTRFSEDS